jgi:hypothetical protein
MNPWKALVVKHKAKSVKPVPEGWLTRAQVAEKIGCAESRVNENLRSAIKAKDVLVDKFPIWDAIEGKVVTIQCYSISSRKPAEAAPTKGKPGRWPFPVGTQVRRYDSPQTGVVIAGGRIEWANGRICTPQGSTCKKILAV